MRLRLPIHEPKAAVEAILLADSAVWSPFRQKDQVPLGSAALAEASTRDATGMEDGSSVRYTYIYKWLAVGRRDERCEAVRSFPV